jgi:hypothetical protein
MTATLTHGAPLASVRAARAPSKSLLAKLVATFWLLVDSFEESKAMARAAHEHLPFAEW